ncbi:prepilin peptidase [Granulicella pectinivorans]|uniref:prepilin peptidase n=1 Tax=Granulicella pectinivorans TaxID=474950 RepID=UPI001FE5FD2B|nr:A24 family peptidase [Granulicella pectinivorans]
MLELWLITGCAFVIGLLLGSFLNVCIARLPYGESIVTPRSHCPACHHAIRWYDNIPILSWLLLRARCRDCGQKISWQYPAVEIATGLWFMTAFAHAWDAWGMDQTGQVGPWMAERLTIDVIAGIATLILGFLLIGLLVMDWQTHRLPDAFTLSGIAIGFFLVCTQAIFLGPTEDQVLLHHKAPITAAMSVEKGNVFLTGPEALLGGRLVAIVGAALLLLAIRQAYKLLRKRDGMGLGDIKLLAMIAAFLGFWPAILALFAGVLTASLYAALLLVRGRANRLTRLPFGSFLAAGGLFSSLFGPALLDWYTSLFR